MSHKNKAIVRDALFFATLVELSTRAISRVPNELKVDAEGNSTSKKLVESLVYSSMKNAINERGGKC